MYEKFKVKNRYRNKAELYVTSSVAMNNGTSRVSYRIWQFLRKQGNQENSD